MKRPRRIPALAALVCILLLGIGLAQQGFPGRQAREQAPPATLAPGDAPPADEYVLEDGYALELVAGGLTFPTAVEVTPDGDVYVVEGGWSYGPAFATPRILRVGDGGNVTEVARLPDGPLTGIVHHNDSLYVVGGRAPATVWRVDPATGDVGTVASGFPVWGRHFTGQLDVGPDGRLYFGVGDPSNAGVIDHTDYQVHDFLPLFPDARGIPCVDLTLTGRNYVTPNPFTPQRHDNATTGAFQRFGVATEPGQQITGTAAPGCNGAIFRVHPDGTGVDAYATGLRNPYGLRWIPDGRLFTVDQGMDREGVRAVAHAPDVLWEVEAGAWYGFPDYVGGIPVTDPRFDPQDQPAPERLLADHPDPPGEPQYRFAPHSATLHLEVSGNDSLFAAQFGSIREAEAGHAIVRVNLTSGEAHDFYVNRAPGPNGTAPERPASLRASPDGTSLYVVDFGGLIAENGNFIPAAQTGGLWRIHPSGSAAGGNATTEEGRGNATAEAPGPGLLAVGAGAAAAAAARGRRETQPTCTRPKSGLPRSRRRPAHRAER